MSFEGYYQVLCKNGHYYEEDAYEDPKSFCEQLFNGAVCGAVTGWHNLVDETNGEADGCVELVQLTEREVKTCNLGHQHIWTHETYVPSTESALSILAKTVVDSDD